MDMDKCDNCGAKSKDLMDQACEHGICPECEAEYCPACDRDVAALDRIHKLLDGREWSVATLSAIADVVRSTGRAIREPKEPARIRDLSIFPDRRKG